MNFWAVIVKMSWKTIVSIIFWDTLKEKLTDLLLRQTLKVFHRFIKI